MKRSSIPRGQRVVELLALEGVGWRERRACEGVSIGI